MTTNPDPSVAPLMPGSPLLQFEPLHEGVLIKRYKRFLADVSLNDGSEVTVHCANTGPMTGVLIPGQRVRLRYAPSPKRKLAWTWEQAEVPGLGRCQHGASQSPDPIGHRSRMPDHGTRSDRLHPR